MSYPTSPVLDSLELALALKKKELVIYNQSELIMIVTLTNQRRGSKKLSYALNSLPFSGASTSFAGFDGKRNLGKLYRIK